MPFFLMRHPFLEVHLNELLTIYINYEVSPLVDIIGIEVDFLTLIPALFGAILSIYNWFMVNKPTDIAPNRLISYGIIR